MADRAGVATPLLDRAVELYERCIAMGLGEHDNAVMVDVIGAMPRANEKKKPPKRKSKAKAKKARKKSKPRRKI